MASSLSFNRKLRIVLVGALFFQGWPSNAFSEIPRPFPVLGLVNVSETHWNDTPVLLNQLAEKVQEEALRFQITSAEAEQYFSIGLLEDSRRAFQRLLK